MSSEETPKTKARGPAEQRSRPLGLLAASLVGIVFVGIVFVGALGLYGMRGRAGKTAIHTGACAKSLDLAQGIAPLVHGEVAALTPATAPIDLTAIAFDDAGGQRTTIAAFKGRTLLLNLWATWCVPCRAEMPALDKLQAVDGSARFQVLPVNVDTARLDKARGFFKEIGATSLPFYSDSSGDILQALKKAEPVDGLPTSILVGPDGCAIATMAGPAAWDSADAKALIAKASS